MKPEDRKSREKMEELKTKHPSASVHVHAPESPNNSSKSKEEGELSSPSDDDHESPSRSTLQLAGQTPASKEPVRVAQVEKDVQLVKPATSVLLSTPASIVGVASRSSIQPNQCKNFEKNRVPFVISFSDDDSGSDSEECRQGKACEIKGEKVVLAGSRGPPAASLAKLKMFSRNAGKGTKMGTRRAPLSQTFVSAMTKINGASSKNRWPLSGELRSHVKNINILKKSKEDQVHKHNQNNHLDSSKLQDLRQLIAIRENELKRKAANQSKESASTSRGDNSGTDLSDKGSKKKRLKVSEPQPCPVNSDARQGVHVVKTTLASEKSVLENCGKQIIDNHACCDKEISLGTMEPSSTRWRKEEENCGSISVANLPSAVKEGTAVIPNGSQCHSIVKLAGHSAQVAVGPAGTFLKKSGTVEFRHPIEPNLQIRPNSIQNDSVPNKERHVNIISGSNELQDVRSGERAIKPVSKDPQQVSSGHIPDNNLETVDASLNNLGFCNSLGKVNISGTSNMDIQSLMEIEELQDKELEEAQEHRRKCEIEERNARKAYRKAQRDLIEAESRCSYLYNKRELYSAHFRSHVMGDPSFLLSSRQHDFFGAGLNSSNKMPEVNMMHIVPTSSHQIQVEYVAHNQRMYCSDERSDNFALQNLSDQHEDGQDLVSDPCSEPDVSTSEPQKDNAIGSQSNDLNMSADEGDETFFFHHEANESNMDQQRKEEIYEVRKKHVHEESKTFDSSQDSLLLEASLRSQLFERLGLKKSSNKRALSQSLEPATGNSAYDDGEDRTETIMVNLPVSEVVKEQHFYLGGSGSMERSIPELPVQIKNKCYVEKFSSNYGSPSNTNPLDSSFPIEVRQSIKSSRYLYPNLRSTFFHMKVVDMISLVQSHAKPQEIHPCYVYDRKSYGVSHNGITSVSLRSSSTEETSIDICLSKVGSYSSNPEIDPLWPLCMYELRGKCNNDECTWQHVSDRSCRNMNQDNSNSGDGHFIASLQRAKPCGATDCSKYLDLLGFAPPCYLVSSDILRADLHPYKSILAQSFARCWQKNFTVSLVLSSLLPIGFPSGDPFLHGPEARVEFYGSWNRQSSYFHSRHGTVSQLNQHLISTDESLEMALLSLSKEANKQKVRIEALKVLARALEADPMSAVLWIVYLHIYYSNQKTVGKDDMFKCAVEHNEGSYELWLMYINSREQLDDRLVAYDTALSAVSHHASSHDRDAIHASECILDLFLQMMNTLCVSGKIVKAIEKIYGLFPSRKKSDEVSGLYLSDILPCLTIWEKCIFWVCCVYLVVYKKLPDAVVLQFECQKELSAIDWPSTNLTVDEKQQAVNLMEIAVDSLAMYIDSESLESETALKAAHLFAVNHVRCIAVLEGLECSRSLLHKYIRLYPSCLELVLMAARAPEQDFGNLSFLGFEEALGNWLEEVPGVQCIWNQYAECALQNGRDEYVKELMDRWFHSVWKVQCSRNKISDTMDIENSFGSPDPDSWISTSNQIDVAFGLLNLSLYKLLQNKQAEAHIAIDNALKGASAENLKHCVREHAMFLLTDGSQSKDAPISEILKIVNGYLVDSGAAPAIELLSRKFIQSIKKPRVQQLVSNLFSPVSPDFSVVNLVLEVWYGPSLLPQAYDKLGDIVDLVEAIMEILPGNYPLAISVCKLLSRSFNSAEVSPPSISFWASSILVNALFQTVPVAPEYIWVEAASTLREITGIKSISESFHKRALSVYPFSLKLWKSHLNLSKITGDGNAVIEAARRRGIEIY